MLHLNKRCPLGGTADTVDLESTAMSMRVRISQGVQKNNMNFIQSNYESILICCIFLPLMWFAIKFSIVLRRENKELDLIYYKRKFSNMKTYIDEIANAESEKSFWEINNITEEGRLELLFFPFENPKNNEELNTHLTIKVSRKQLDDLFEFCKRMNEKIK